MKKAIMLSLLALINVGFLLAQTKSIEGKVIDKVYFEPLSGVSVIQNHTTNGTITDVDGNYKIKNVDFSGIITQLVFSYEGKKTVFATITSNIDRVNVIMEDEEENVTVNSKETTNSDNNVIYIEF